MYVVKWCGRAASKPPPREDAEALAGRVRVACIGVAVERASGGMT